MASKTLAAPCMLLVLPTALLAEDEPLVPYELVLEDRGWASTAHFLARDYPVREILAPSV